MKKNLLKKLGIAGLIAWVLLQGGYSLYTKYQHGKIKDHLAKIIEYSNAYMFPQALLELDQMEQLNSITPEEKSMSMLLKKIILELQNSPEKSELMDSLNEIVVQSSLLQKDLVEAAKKQGNSTNLKEVLLRKQNILKELDTLSQVNLTSMTSAQRYSHEAKKLTLLNQLNRTMSQIQSGIPDEKPIDNLSPEQKKKQALLVELQKLNRVNESKLTPKQRVAHLKKKQNILKELQSILDNDSSSLTLAQENRQKEIIEELKKLHNINEAKLSPKERQELKVKRAKLQQELENILTNSKPLTPSELAIKQEETERLKKIEEQNRLEQEKLDTEKRKLEEEKNKLSEQQLQGEKLKEVEALKMKAKSAFAAENYEKALGLYDELEKLNPNDAETQAMKAYIYSRLNRNTEAQAALTKALSLSKGESIVDLVKAEIALANNDIQGSTALYTAILNKGDSALALFRLANIALRQKATTKALDYYQRAIKAPDYDILEKNIQVKLFHNLGQAYLAKNNQAEAKKSFNAALKIDSDYIPSNISLGQVYYKEKNYTSANYYLSLAIKLDPKNFAALSMLGNSMNMQKDYNGAKNAMLQALAIQPNNQTLLYNLGSVEILLQDYTNAVVHLEEALKLKPSNNVKIQLGLALVKSKQNLVRAQQLFTEAVTDDPKDMSAIKGLIEVYNTQLKYTDALNYIEKVRQDQPKDTEILYKKAEVLFKMKRYPESIAAFNELITLDDSAENHFQLATTLLSSGQSNEAVTEYNTAIAKKETAEFLEGRANAFIKTGKLKAAQEDLRKIIANYKSYPQMGRVNQKLNNINRLIPGAK